MTEEYEAADLMSAALDRTRFLYRNFFVILDDVTKKNKEKFTKNVHISSDAVWDQLVEYYRFHGFSTDNTVDMSRATSRLCAFYHWRQHKKIYEFDEDLADALMDQDISDLVIDEDFFLRLPFNGLCLHIHSAKHQMNQCIIVYTDWTKEDGLALNFCTFSVPHLVREYTNKVSPRGMVCSSEYKVRLIQDETLGNVIKSVSGSIDIGYEIRCMKLMNLLLYILAANSDITYKGSHKPKLKIEYTNDEPDRVETMIAGKNVGKIIRRWNEEYEEEVRKHRELDPDKVYVRRKPKGFKIPHMRAGHWHHYWCGSGENRHLEPVWLDPIFINKVSFSTESAGTNTSKVTR